MRGLFGVFVGSVWPHMSNFVWGPDATFRADHASNGTVL